MKIIGNRRFLVVYRDMFVIKTLKRVYWSIKCVFEEIGIFMWKRSLNVQKIKDFIRNNLGVVVISVSFICLFIGGCLLRSAGERGRNDTSATRTMAGVEDGFDRAERGVRTAQREIANAEHELNGARKTTDEITRTNQDSQKLIVECERIISRHEESIKRLEGIIKDVETRNKENGTSEESN